LTGEDVGKFADLTHNNLKHLKSASKYTTATVATVYCHIPDDFQLTLIQLLQTTSVMEFNDIFHLQEMALMTQKATEDPQATAPPSMDAIEEILTMASKEHVRHYVHPRKVDLRQYARFTFYLSC